MTDDRDAVEARHILENPLFNRVMNEMEASAVGRVTSAARSDDATLRHAAIELSVIRSLRSNFRLLSRKDKTNG